MKIRTKSINGHQVLCGVAAEGTARIYSVEWRGPGADAATLLYVGTSLFVAKDVAGYLIRLCSGKIPSLATFVKARQSALAH